MGGTQTGDEVLTAAARLRSDGIRFVRVMHPDPYGRARSKELPVDSLADVLHGLGYCEASLVEGLDGEPLMGARVPGRPGLPGRARRARSRARCAARRGSRHGLDAGRPARAGRSEPALLPRGAARARSPRSSGAGLRAVVASEPEFYLVREHADGRVDRTRPAPAWRTRRACAPTRTVSCARSTTALDSFEIGVTTANREFSPGQFEINLSHTDALAAADRAFLLEEIVKDVAASERAARDVHGEAVQRARGLEPSRARLALVGRRQRLRDRRRQPQRARVGVRGWRPRPRRRA